MFVSSFPISGFWPFSLSKNSNLEKQSKVGKLATRIFALPSIFKPRPKGKIAPNRMRKEIYSPPSFNKIRLDYLCEKTPVIGSQATVQFGKLPSGKEVAVKIYKNPSVFARELDLFRRVHGAPHLAKVEGFTSVKSRNAIVMEKAKGGDLLDILKYLELNKKTLPLSTVLMLAQQLLEPLKTLHEAGVVHRDIKPENILCNPDTKEFIITDLGSATVYLEEDSKQESGTGVYASPEFLLNLPPDPVQDIWSLGLTLYTAFTGRLLLQPSESHPRLLKNLQEEFGAIPQRMIQEMDSEKRERFFVLKQGQYVFREEIKSETTWTQTIRTVGMKNNESEEFVESFIDLLDRMLSYIRPTAEALLTHPSMQKDVSFKVYIEGKESVSLDMTSKARDKKGHPLAERHFKLLPKRSTCLHVPLVPGGKYRLRISDSQQVKQEEISISQGRLLEISL